MDFDWSLFSQVLIGTSAILTAIITILRWGFFPWRERQRKRRLAEKRVLEEKKKSVQSIVWQLRESIKERVLPNKISQGTNVGWWVEEFETRIKEYHKRFERCRDWLEGCKAVIQIQMMSVTKDKFPQTVTAYPLGESLQADPLIDMYVAGENVTLTSISENYPSLHKDLMEKIKDEKAEHKLNTFFLEINRFFKNSDIMKRFRQEKKELIEFADQLAKDLEREIERIDGGLSKYSNLEYDEAPELKAE